MTNTTNAAPASTTHAACTHPKTKVDRARCRKARAVASTRVVSYPTYRSHASKVVHYAYAATVNSPSGPACTRVAGKLGKYDINYTSTTDVTCKNCSKLDPSAINSR